MPAQKSPSIRQIADAMGLSKATVANSLNGSDTVAAATLASVREMAAKMGYRHNPMVGAFMSAMRRSQRSAFQGVIAIVEILEPERPQHGPFHRELHKGCEARAGELGFKTEFYQLTPTKLTPERLSSILKARGIRGLILLPTWRPPEFSRFDWSSITGVYADYITSEPVLNAVCCDHYRSIFDLLRRLESRGYRRPGLVLEKGRDERVHLRVSAALRTFPTAARRKPVNPLFAPELDAGTFARWLKRERPDVVLGHDPEILDWIEALGLGVPDDLGFVALNLAKVKKPCAALNLHADQIGRCSVEILIGQIQRQAWGMPRFPTTTTLIGEFVDGETLRKAAS